MSIKRDIKQIIKRIIIGVSVGFILANINKCSVYAEELPTYNVLLNQNESFTFPNSQGNYNEYATLKSPYSNNNYKYLSTLTSSSFTSNYTIFYNETYDLYLFIIIGYNRVVDTDLSKIKINISSNSVSYYYYDSSRDDFIIWGGFERVFILSENQLSNFSTIWGTNYNYYAKNSNTNEYFYQTQLNENLLNGWSLYSTNTSYLQINDDIIYNQDPPIPQEYVELDITGMAGVYFYPKDLRNIDNICEDSNGNLVGAGASCVYEKFSYKFYLKGAFQYVLSDSIYTSMVSNKRSLDVFSDFHEFYVNIDRDENFMNIMFYNNNDLSSSVGVSSPAFIKYDSSKLNYQLIENIDDEPDFNFSIIGLDGNTYDFTFTGVPHARDVQEISLSLDESLFENFNEEIFDELFESLSKTFSFFTANLRNIFVSLPNIFIATITIMLLVLFIKKIIYKG